MQTETAATRADNIIARAVAVRMAQGLSVEVTGIAGRAEPHVSHCANIADRDAYIARCKARGETVRIMGA